MIVVTHACPDERIDSRPGAYLLRCADLALFFARRPTREMRAKAERRKPWNERERRNER